MTRVNLIPAKLQCRRQLRRRRAAWIAAASTYAGLLALGCLAWRIAFVTPPVVLGDEIQRLHHDADDRSAEFAKLRSSLAEHRAALWISESLAARPDWSHLLSIVSRACGEDAVLKRCDVAATGELPPPDRRPAPHAPAGAASAKPPEPPRSVLRIDGLAPTQAAMSRFALRLEQTGVFESVEPSSSRQTFDGSEVIAFHLDCWLLTAAPKRASAAHVAAAADATGVIP